MVQRVVERRTKKKTKSRKRLQLADQQELECLKGAKEDFEKQNEGKQRQVRSCKSNSTITKEESKGTKRILEASEIFPKP